MRLTFILGQCCCFDFAMEEPPPIFYGADFLNPLFSPVKFCEVPLLFGLFKSPNAVTSIEEVRLLD